ncbi:MAG: glycosyltransferase family 4 protein [Phycisphaerales bacterium]|nr:glycosyltransferase family 4 protein [Phycisphaerales bacterium]
MTSVLHVIDRSCDETQLQVLDRLRARLTSEGRQHVVCSIDPEMMQRGSVHLGEAIVPAFRRLPRFMNWVPSLQDVVSDSGTNIVHAWGIEAAAACSTRLPGIPLVMTLLDPDVARDAANWVRSFPTSATVVAGSQVIRSRLVTAGVAPEQVVVIRGPADFGAINRARENDIRREIVGDAGPVLLTGGPASRGGGQYYGLWAAAILKQVFPDLTVIVPYDSPERRRLLRFVRQIEMPSLITPTDSRLTWPEMAVCADVFVMPAVDEVCIEPLATAMAAGLVVVGTAVRSIAEVIADRNNGLLCKNSGARLVAGRILNALEDESLRRQVTEIARGQAFEVFGIRAFVDNYAQVYDNLLTGKTPGEKVKDTAMVA